MPIEIRTRVDVFLPLRSGLIAYQVALDWMAEEFAYQRGGATLTAPFAGLFVSTSRVDIVEDAIRVLSCDFDLDAGNEEDLSEITTTLENVKEFLMDTLREEEIWIVFYPISRIIS